MSKIVKKSFKNIILFFPQFFGTILFLWEERKNLKKNGGKCIFTHFKYKPLSGGLNKNFTFKTILQFDGDIINKYPDPVEFENDDIWENCYSGNYLKHKKKIEDYISKFDGIYSIQWIISIIATWSPALFLKDLFITRTAEVQSETQFLCLYYLSCIVINVIFKRFACRYLMYIMFHILKRWLFNLRKRHSVLV